MCHRAGVVHLRTGAIVSGNNGIMSLGALPEWCFPHLLVCQVTAFLLLLFLCFSFSFFSLEVQPEYISFYNCRSAFAISACSIYSRKGERQRRQN